MVPAPTTISSAASAGNDVYPTRSENTTTTTAITPPEMNSDVRVFAPACTTRAVADIDPPVGIPWNRPETMLPTPCPMKSRDEFAGLPSGLGERRGHSRRPAPTRRTPARPRGRSGWASP